MPDLLESAIMTMRRYAHARNRSADREPRQIILTDDQAVAVLAALDAVQLPPGEVRARDGVARLVWETPGNDPEVQLLLGEVRWGGNRWSLADGEDPTALALALLAASGNARRQVEVS